ncbi:hypothetical protein AK88_04719 [Plasmodium fragile]|uniref:Schizont-infected cell agglutination extracellular alpha domain-containing protein n=1 Tax=Plasmodium fragile TaxID=5857 RepID=A0A0D9QFS3_PLAFR|nr:uncharacterized protein AK88_04719 [Plasmodium fragile]KJP85647.1 hypothetical protein AK88_04719 [Plasmodium fragile]
MWDYLLVLWDNYIEKGDVGVRDRNIKDWGTTFWENVKHVWQEFKEYVEKEQHGGRAQTMCEVGRDGEQGGLRTSADMGICELTYIALHFKHGIQLDGTRMSQEGMDEQKKKIHNYMRCMLVNIFMKKIMGMNCLGRPGGQFAFNLANAEVKTVYGREVGNIACEEEDAREGGVKGVKAADRDFWEIMNRWIDRNKLKLKDGQVGVLGNDCKVQGRGRASDREALKEHIKKEIGDMGKDIKDKVHQILPEVNECTDKACVRRVLGTKKQEDDARSKAPKVTGDAQVRGTHGTQATPSSSGSSSSTSKSPGRSQNDHAAKTGQGEQGRPTPPAAAKPNKPATAAKPVAGKPVAKKPPEVQDCQGDRLLEWKHKTVYVVKGYSDKEWEPVKKVLDEFKTYMEHGQQHMDAYGANCYNVGWDDLKEDGNYYKGQTVADVVRCRFMSVALGWANGWGNSNTDKDNTNDDTKDKEMYEQLRCEVVNVFGHLLRKRYCPEQDKWRRGTEYAGIAFKQMKSPGQHGHGGLGGPVMDGRCTMCGYGHNKQHVDAVNLDIVNWLMQEGKILDGMDKIEGGANCTKKWEEYTKGKTKANEPTRVDETKIPEIKDTETTLQEEAKKIIEQVKAAVEEEIQKKQNEGTNMNSAAAKPAATKPQAPASPVLPARPPPPASITPQAASPRPTADGSENAGETTGPETKETEPHSTVPKADVQDAKATSKSPPEEPAQTGAPVNPPESTDNTVTPPDSTGNGQHGASGEKGPPGVASPGVQDTVVDKGNDDPPPLNPAKPKPNPNPDQSGASGSGPDGTRGGSLADGVSGGEGKGGAAVGGGGETGGSTGHQTPGSSGSVSQDPRDHENSKCTKGCGQESKPECDLKLSLGLPDGGQGVAGGFVPPTLPENKSSSSNSDQGPGDVSVHDNAGMLHVQDVYTSEHPNRLQYMIVLIHIFSCTRIHSFYPTVLTLLFTPFFCA